MATSNPPKLTELAEGTSGSSKEEEGKVLAVAVAVAVGDSCIGSSKEGRLVAVVVAVQILLRRQGQ